MGASLADMIQARRLVRGMERQDLASAVGCDVRTVRRWESGSRPLARHFPALREALGISIEDMDRVILELVSDRGGRLRIEGPEYLSERGLSHTWLAETLLAMDRRLVGCDPTLGVHDPGQWASIFAALPDSWRLLTHNGEIVGNWQFVPLAQGVHEEMRAGRLHDSQIGLTHSSSLDLKGVFDLNVTALVVEPAYRHGKGLAMLFRSFGAQLCNLALRGIQFSRVSAIAWTPQSVLLCQRLGMRSVRSTNNGTGAFFEVKIGEIHDPLGLTEFDQLKRHYNANLTPNDS